MKRLKAPTVRRGALGGISGRKVARFSGAADNRDQPQGATAPVRSSAFAASPSLQGLGMVSHNHALPSICRSPVQPGFFDLGKHPHRCRRTVPATAMALYVAV